MTDAGEVALATLCGWAARKRTTPVRRPGTPAPEPRTLLPESSKTERFRLAKTQDSTWAQRDIETVNHRTSLSARSCVSESIWFTLLLGMDKHGGRRRRRRRGAIELRALLNLSCSVTRAVYADDRQTDECANPQ